MVSTKENRSLAKFPKLIKNHSLNYHFGYQINDWFNDRFFLRDFFISIYEKKYIFMQEFETKHVVKGKDNWLFLGDNAAKESFINKNLFSPDELASIDKYLYDINEFCKKNNKNFYFIIPPDKSKIYGEYYTDLIKPVRKTGKAEQLIQYLNSNSKINSIYLKDILISHKNQYLLYYKNDTHWNELGAYWGYYDLMQNIKKIYKNINIYKIKNFKQITHNGDLKTGLSQKNDNNLNKDFKYTIPDIADAKGHCNNIEDTKKCINNTQNLNAILFGDSFSEYLCDYLTESFNKLKIVKINDLSKKNIEDFDIIILEVVERNLPTLINKEFK